MFHIFFSDKNARVTLWGKCAFEFCVQDVYNSEKSTPIVVLFVGCLARTF
jgi:hypothetical protein